MSKKKLILIILAVVVVAVVVYLNMTMNTTKMTKVNSEKAKLRELTEIVSASGRIQPQTKVDITSEVNGEIITLFVKEGNFVNEGDLLVVLDTVQLRSDLDQAKYSMIEIDARLEGAKSNRDQAQEENDRQKRLYEDELTSETQFTNAKYAYIYSEASYKATKAQAQQSKARYNKQLDYLSKAKIVAPMKGVITFLDCEEGEIAPAQTAFTQGKTLMTISNLDVFEVEVEVDETEINKVELGQQVDIEVDAFIDTIFAGEVVEIGNTAILAGLGSQDQSTNFRVKVIFNDPIVKIRPGMSATVDIITNKKDEALTIPYSAVVIRLFDLDSLQRARDGDTVESALTGSTEVQAAEINDSLDIDEDKEIKREELKGTFVIRDGIAKFVEIKSGIADQKNIEVLSGLEPGDKVISGPYSVLRTIKDGDNVEIIKKEDKDKKE